CGTVSLPYEKKAAASRRTPNFVPNHFCGWNMPYAKAKTDISMKDQGKSRVSPKKNFTIGCGICTLLG
ncbi:MAG: hypothetical protein ACLFQ6_13235, partial [Candidatus Sumerlaeia bacterium]